MTNRPKKKEKKTNNEVSIDIIETNQIEGAFSARGLEEKHTQ